MPAWSPVERIWFARGSSEGRETILPDGRFELVFNFGDAVRQDGVAQPRAMLSAETRRAVTIEATGRADFVGVTLRDGRAPRIIGAPLREVRDSMREYRGELLERLAGKRDEERVRIISNAFADAEPDTLAEHASAAIRRRHGQLSMTRLAASCGVSVRTLNRAFDRSLGMTPKTLARVCRINRAATLLRDGNAASEVALDAGFYDQPHLVNEFRTIAGLSPSRWIELPPGLGVQFLQDGRDANR